MSHDQRFKDLLRAFFEEFMLLFYPEIARHLDFSRVTFLDKETFTDIPEGKQRESDLVVEVSTLDGQVEIILMHIEIEFEWGSDFDGRMFDYFTLLRLRYRLPIFPIAIFITSGRGGLVQEQFVERVFDQNVVVFTYNAVGLPGLRADDYIGQANPLAPALSALMRTSRLGKVAQKFQSLLALVRSGVDEARLTLLTNMVETYLTLNDQERESFATLVATPEGKEVQMVVSIYEERGIEKGIQQGITQGVTRGEQKLLLRLIERKFGDVPEDVRLRVEAITEVEAIEQLADTILTAQSLEEMGL